ncbi:MAG: hypothetical protein VYB54_03730 [Pseudomonadota bacterium]|nr:hypothetical protein [Pseudomonadota bacterium]
MPVPSLPEIARALFATWRIARGDRGAVAYLPNTPDAVWKSFFAAVLLAPFWAVVIWAMATAAWADYEPLPVALINLASYAAAWLVWPVLSHEIARFGGCLDNWCRYVVAYNWSEIWIMMLRLPIVAVMAGGLLDTGPALLLWLVSLALVVGYRYLIAREVLGLGAAAAFGTAILEVLVSYAWGAFENAMLAPYFVPHIMD